MQFDEDLDAYLEDFGDSVSAPDLTIEGYGIFSQAEREIFGGVATAPEFVMIARTDVFGVVETATRIEVASGLCAGAYTVSARPQQLADGAFCQIFLAKARP
jgi:hypothetical protein